MRPEARDNAHIRDMREAAREALGFVENIDFAGFVSNRAIWLSVERLLEILGEAARRISRGTS